MSEDDVRALLLKRAAKAKTARHGSTGLRAWCRENGVAVSHASEFLGGRRAPGHDLLRALNLEYRIVRRKAKP